MSSRARFPARTDVSDADFDDCGKKGMQDLAEANDSQWHALWFGRAWPRQQRQSVKNAIYDVVTAHFNGEYDSETAVEELLNAIDAAM